MTKAKEHDAAIDCTHFSAGFCVFCPAASVCMDAMETGGHTGDTSGKQLFMCLYACNQEI